MKVMRSVVIDAPIDKVWAAVRRFDGVANWNPGVTAAVLESGLPTEVGAIRKLDIADGSVFRETLLAHSDLKYFYTYDIIESPLPCRNYVSCHRFIEITDGERTLGVWQGEFDCAEADAEQLEVIVGDMIYLAAQQALNQYLNETT
ncbi:MAG: SRPBCC family protein [Gammaproteobacteria bacterium]|jgi:ligand-binding SRPBCC domain-containing protein|tara:strand:- start:10 stop:447 length:438 start_codon:yes stop_codon:yes gene_type:complete